MALLQTLLGALTIELAKPDELQIVIEIIDEAAAWLHAKGITKQWPSRASQELVEFMTKQIARGDVFLARLADGSAIGTFRFDWIDEELWAQDPEGGGYVHSFAIRDGAHGHRVGAAMIEWANQHVRARGKKYLRLDCWGENESLRRYYTDLGFTLVAVVNEKDWVDATFQMQA